MRVAIVGYGVEGKASYDYWSADPANEVVIVDERSSLASEIPEDAQAILGENALSCLEGFDLVVRTAGLPPYSIKTDAKVWSATNEFFAKCPARIIGVTGSKGKGTTSSLIASIIEESGRKVWLVGNIGQPALEVLNSVSAEDVVVYELSSFQLWDLEKSPHIAVVLHIEQEHLNVHKGMEDYVSAKANIARHQTNNCSVIYNVDNKYATEIANLSAGKKIPYPSEDYAHIVEGDFFYKEQKICSSDVLKLVGDHNKQNSLAAIAATREWVTDPATIERGLTKFKGLPHRLAFIKSVDGVDYYDDSIATTPSSAVAALRAFSDRSKVLILGGSSKGSDFTELTREVMNHDVKVILVGEEATTISNSFTDAGFEDYELMVGSTMGDVVKKARQLSRPHAVVLLSPAAASFGDFTDYIDRGNQFIKAVEEL